MSFIFQDWRVNRHHARGQLVLAAFRFCSLFAKRRRSLRWWLGLPFLVAYRLFVEYLLGIELKPTTRVGPRLRIDHGVGLVVNDKTVIGADVHLRHCTTIGCVTLPDGNEGPSPCIGDRVEIGSNAVVLGGIRLGDGCKVGAGSVVLQDVPDGWTAVGNPARLIRPSTAPFTEPNP